MTVASNNRHLRVLAMVPAPKDTTPGQRFRIEQWAPLLRSHGIDVRFSPFMDSAMTNLLRQPGRILPKTSCMLNSWLKRLREARLLSGYDLVYVFREGSLIGPAVAERILHLRGIPFVFDFDDAIWIRYISPTNSFFSYLRFPGKTSTLCRLARHVLVGNQHLGEYAARRNKRVTIVPTTIDTETYRPLRRDSGSVPTIGWTGSYSTERHLSVVRDALGMLRQRHVFRLVVIGGGDFSLDVIDVEHRPWRSSTEVQDLNDIDVGIMPLPDSPWERGKCGLKALQFMALGIPVVVSPVGVNTEIVRNGVNGFLAARTEDWISALDHLLSNARQRHLIGEQARATVEREYSAHAHSSRIAAVFREVIT